tara:strand:- start:1503 stop:4832 length:3330 start_codon:yes stop_codon:yes gene_type:complete
MGSDEARDKVPTNFVMRVYETKVLAEEGDDNNALYVFDNGIDNESSTQSNPIVANGSQFVQGVATTNTSGKLISSASLFGSRLAGKTVHNDTDGTTGTINSDGVDSTTQLTLAGDTFPDGNENYHIEAPGHYFTFQKYFYRIDASDVVSGFIIDWDDGEDNSPEKANRQTIMLDTPRAYAVVEHTYTKHGTFYPLIRTISVDGFYSKFYSSFSRHNLDRTKSLETQSVAAGQNDFSILSFDVEEGQGVQTRIPEFSPANMPPVAKLTVDRMSVFSGIDNDIVTGNVYGYAHIDRLSSQSALNFTDGIEVIYKTTNGNILKQTITPHSTRGTADNSKFPADNNDGYLDELLSVKILKLKEGAAGNTSLLAADERIHIYMTTGTGAATDSIITTVSLGNPIQTVDRPGFSVMADGSMSQSKCSNVTISSYMFDTGKLNYYSTSANETYYHPNLEQISDTIGAAQGATNLLDQTESNLRVHYHQRVNAGDVIDSDSKRFYDTHRLIRLQVEDSSDDTRTDAATFYETTNQADSSAQLAEALDTSETEIDVDGGAGGASFDIGDIIAIDTEFMLVQSIASNTITVVRGYQSTTAATHNDNTTIYILKNNGKLGDSISLSFVEHWDRITYSEDRNIPSSLKTRALLMYANNTTSDHAGTPGAEMWTERMLMNNVNYSNFGSTSDDNGDSALVFGGTRHADGVINATQLSHMMQGQSDRPTNYLLCCKTDKFNKLFFRMENTFKRASDALESDDIYAAAKLGLTVWYTAKDTKHGTDYIWKPLSFTDGTATGGEHSSLRTSGPISFDMPDDWASIKASNLPWTGSNNKPISHNSNLKSVTSLGAPNLLAESGFDDSETSVTVDDGTVFNVNDVIVIDNEEMKITSISANVLTVTRGFNSTTAASHSDDTQIFIANKDPENLWTENMYGLLVGIGAQGDDADTNAKYACYNVTPASNSHSAIIKIEDPHHKSLNDIAIAQGVSWVRKGKFINITDRLGRAEIRKIGASGGAVTFGGVEISGEYTTQKKLLNKYQREGTPVYLDIERAISATEYIRFYGKITSMTEDYPVGQQLPKFAINMEISHVSEFSGSTGTVIGDGVLMSLGGEIIDEPKYLL